MSVPPDVRTSKTPKTRPINQSRGVSPRSEPKVRKPFNKPRAPHKNADSGPPVQPGPTRSGSERASLKKRPSLDLDISPEAGAQYVPFIRPRLLDAHAILRPALQHLSLALVNDAKMSQLHQEFLNIPGPTDVLTFEIDHDAKGRVTAGEVIVCLPEARRQAKNRGSTVRKELLLYALHGMLHLSGFDDRTASGYRKMHHTEDQILTRLGVGPVFAADTPTRRSRRRRAPSAKIKVK